MDETMEVCGFSIRTCAHGTKVQPHAVRAAMGAVPALLVFGRLNEIGQSLIDSGMLVGRVRAAVEHVALNGGFGPPAGECEHWCHGQIFEDTGSCLCGFLRSETTLTGVKMIATERARQIEVERWTAEHDRYAHAHGELISAATCYARRAEAECFSASCIDYRDVRESMPSAWPWGNEWWKPSDDPVRNLVKAGALIAAEIDRVIATRAGAR